MTAWSAKFDAALERAKVIGPLRCEAPRLHPSHTTGGRMSKPKLAAMAKLCLSGLYPLVDRIAREHGVTVSAVVGRGRTKAVARARAHAMAVIRSSTGLSSTEIGDLFDRDHTTVLAAVASWEAELAARVARLEVGS